MKKILSVLALCTAAAALLWGQQLINGYRDWSLMTAPGNPASGLLRTVADTAKGKLVCLDSNGVSCFEGGNIPVLISTSGAVSDPGGPTYYQFNNAAGSLTFNAPAGVIGMQRCYRNATGKSGAITIQMAASNAVDVAGVNGSTGTNGKLTSAGALGDAACIVSDAANHWYAYINSGTWTNN